VTTTEREQVRHTMTRKNICDLVSAMLRHGAYYSRGDQPRVP
jgi:hypothetical protein